MGSSSRNDIVVNWLNTEIVARLVQINPRSWENSICLRVDFYGCTSSGKSEIVSVHFSLIKRRPIINNRPKYIYRAFRK